MVAAAAMVAMAPAGAMAARAWLRCAGADKAHDGAIQWELGLRYTLDLAAPLCILAGTCILAQKTHF